MKRMAAVILIATTLLLPGVALAGASTDAALGLGAFAVFNQILSGTGIFGVGRPAVVAPAYVVPPPPPVAVVPRPVYVAPQPVYVAPQPVYVAPQPVYVAPPPVVIVPRPVVYGHPPVYHYRGRFHAPAWGRDHWNHGRR